MITVTLPDDTITEATFEMLALRAFVTTTEPEETITEAVFVMQAVVTNRQAASTSTVSTPSVSRTNMGEAIPTPYANPASSSVRTPQGLAPDAP